MFRSPPFSIIIILMGLLLIGFTSDQAYGVEQALAGDNPAKVEFGQAKVNMAGQTYTLELASNDTQRARGLMYRTELCSVCGMLFDFTESRYVGMWMKNTNIPLDVAYVDSRGRIINIEQMQPHTLQAHYSQAAVRYAIEMNLGWFAQQGIEPGDNVRFISAMPKN